MTRWGTNMWFSVALIALCFASALGRGNNSPAEGNRDGSATPESVYVEDVIGALERTTQEMATLSHLAGLNAEHVRTVDVDELVNDNDEASQILEEMMMTRENTILSLREAIGSRVEMLQALQAQALELSQVIAVDVLEDGSVIVFCK